MAKTAIEQEELVQAQLQRWHELMQYWESLPERVVLDVHEAVWRFRQALASLDRAQDFTLEILGILLQYVQYPAQEWLFETMEYTYDNYGALEGKLNFYGLMRLVEALGVDLIARLQCWKIHQRGQPFLYQLEDLLGLDVVIKKLTLTELEDLYASGITAQLTHPRYLRHP